MSSNGKGQSPTVKTRNGHGADNRLRGATRWALSTHRAYLAAGWPRLVCTSRRAPLLRPRMAPGSLGDSDAPGSTSWDPGMIVPASIFATVTERPCHFEDPGLGSSTK